MSTKRWWSNPYMTRLFLLPIVTVILYFAAPSITHNASQYRHLRQHYKQTWCSSQRQDKMESPDSWNHRIHEIDQVMGSLETRDLYIIIRLNDYILCECTINVHASDLGQSIITDACNPTSQSFLFCNSSFLKLNKTCRF